MSSLKDQIINKVDNIYDTKQAIKRAIEDKGQTIEDDLSFYSYADKIRQITAMEGAVKLFETVEEMQADNNAKENDLAVVYRKEIKNMTVTDKPQYLTFPETVTLPEAFTSSSYLMLRAVDMSIMFDGNIQLNQTSFRFDGFSESGMIRVHYTSSDGVTYTRDEFRGDSGDLTNPVDLGTSVGVYRSDGWNDNFGYFMQIGGMTFDGLYEYSKDEKFVDKNYYAGKYYNTNLEESDILIKNINIDYDYVNSLITFDAWNKDFNIECKIITDWDVSSDGNINYIIPKEFYAVYGTRSHTGYWKQLYLNDNKIKIGISGSELPSDVAIPCLHYNNGTYSVENWMPVTYIQIQFYEDNPSLTYTIDNHFIPYNKERGIIIFNDYIESGQVSKSVIYDGINRIEYWDMYCNENGFSESDLYRNYYSYKYLLAPNQYTLTSSNQLLPDISAYGKNGNVTGDGSIYNNLDLSQLFTANGMDIYRDGLVALKESSTGNKIKDVEPFTDGVGFITSNNTIGELFKNYQVIRSKSYIIAYNDTTIKLYDLNYNLLQTGTNSHIKELFLTSKLIYEDADRVVHIGFSNNSYDGYCFLVDLSEDGIKITYVSLDFERIDLICYVGEDKEHNGYKYYVVSRNSLQSSSVRIEAFTTTESGVGYSKRISNVSLTNQTDNDTSYCCFDDNYVYMTLPPYWRKFIVIDKSTDTIIKNNTSESSIYLCNNVGTCYMNTGGDTNSGVYKLNGTSQEKITENKNIPTIFTGLYQYYYIPDYDCIITTMSGGDEVALSTSQALNEICNFRSLLQPYYNGDMNKGGLNTTLYLNGTKLEGLAVLFPDHTDTDAKVFNISVDFTKTLSNEGDINTLPINNGYIGNLVISQMDNTNYNNTLTPEEYLQALQTAKEIKGNKLNNGVVVNKLVSRISNTISYPNKITLPDIKNCLIADPGFEYYKDNELITLQSNTQLPLTIQELLQIFPYYIVIINNDLGIIFFSKTQFSVEAIKENSQFDFEGDGIGQASFEIPIEFIEDRTMTDTEISQLNYTSINHSYSSTSGGYAFINTGSVIMYSSGNIPFTDNTSNKEFS